MSFHPALLHGDGVVAHKGHFLLAAVEVLYKKKLDVLRETMAGGSLLCHPLTRARQCEVTCADRVTLGASDVFCLGETGSPFCGESGVGAQAGLFWKKGVSPRVLLNLMVCEEPPAPARRAQS